MSFTDLTEAFFAKSAGWEAVKSARSLLASGKVISSNWSPPLLKGMVQEGTASYRAGLVIKGPLENEAGGRHTASLAHRYSLVWRLFGLPHVVPGPR